MDFCRFVVCGCFKRKDTPWNKLSMHPIPNHQHSALKTFRRQCQYEKNRRWSWRECSIKQKQVDPILFIFFGFVEFWTLGQVQLQARHDSVQRPTNFTFVAAVVCTLFMQSKLWEKSSNKIQAIPRSKHVGRPFFYSHMHITENMHLPTCWSRNSNSVQSLHPTRRSLRWL